jgi:hypothetical protein
MSSGPKDERPCPMAERLRLPEDDEKATKTLAWATVQARLV